jgi:CheY-like chemotaxis protein
MRVLLIDDDETQLRAVSGLMRLQGFDVETALSPERAMQLLETGRFDGVLVDLMMPRVNGLELIRSLRTRAPHLRIVLTSSFPMTHAQIDRLGFDDVRFVPKPAAPEALRDAFGMPSRTSERPSVPTHPHR